MGVDEEIFVVDLKKGAVSTGPSFPLSFRLIRLSILVRVSENLLSVLVPACRAVPGEA
jgi:hypothetical protein